MNVRTAENLVACHREGMRVDGSVRKALKMSESDELLRAIVQANAAFDAQMVQAIHTVRLPDSLRKKIAECSGPKELRRHARHPAILCAIAGVLLAIGFVIFLEMEKRAGFPGKENADRMVEQIVRMTGVELEVKSGTVGGLEDWLMLRGFDGLALPPDIASLPVVGARTFQSGGHAVAQVAIDRRAVILNVFRASDFDVELAEDGDWKFFEQGKWAAAIRQRRGVCTLLAFLGSIEEMKEFVLTLKP